MRRKIALVAYVAAAAALLCPSAAFGADAGLSAEAQAIESLNQIRASNGLAPLRTSNSLSKSADAYSRHMLAHDFFGHQARIRVASRFHTVGETLAWHSGFQPGARRTVRQWMASPPHRAVLLSSAFRLVGMGMERGRLEGQATTMWVAHVARR
jgi:uncharacterized protein YkwD